MAKERKCYSVLLTCAPTHAQTMLPMTHTHTHAHNENEKGKKGKEQARTNHNGKRKNELMLRRMLSRNMLDTADTDIEEWKKAKRKRNVKEEEGEAVKE